jgi:hypothetical protein
MCAESAPFAADNRFPAGRRVAAPACDACPDAAAGRMLRRLQQSGGHGNRIRDGRLPGVPAKSF